MVTSTYIFYFLMAQEKSVLANLKATLYHYLKGYFQNLSPSLTSGVIHGFYYNMA